MPGSFTEDLLRLLYRATELGSMTIEQRERYEATMRNELDISLEKRYVKEEAFKEGCEEGLAEGEARGREEGLAEGKARGEAKGCEEGRAEGRIEGRAEEDNARSKEIARKLREMGMSTEDILKATGVEV